MKANDTDNYERRQRELAADVLKRAEQDLQRFHGAAGTITKRPPGGIRLGCEPLGRNQPFCARRANVPGHIW